MAKNIENSKKDEKNHIQESTDRKIVLLMGMGLNGISAEGWIPPAETKIEAEEMINDLWSILETIDTFIIGRVTFQMWETYWPYQADKPSNSDFQKKFSKFVDIIQKLTFSTTLKTVNWQNSRVITEDITAEISHIKKLPGKNIAIVGGAGIAQTFTKLNLIDDYQIYLHQVIFGSGKSLLGVLDTEQELNLIDVKQFQSGGLRLHYRPIIKKKN